MSPVPWTQLVRYLVLPEESLMVPRGRRRAIGWRVRGGTTAVLTTLRFQRLVGHARLHEAVVALALAARSGPFTRNPQLGLERDFFSKPTAFGRFRLVCHRSMRAVFEMAREELG